MRRTRSLKYVKAQVRDRTCKREGVKRNVKARLTRRTDGGNVREEERALKTIGVCVHKKTVHKIIYTNTIHRVSVGRARLLCLVRACGNWHMRRPTHLRVRTATPPLALWAHAHVRAGATIDQSTPPKSPSPVPHAPLIEAGDSYRSSEGAVQRSALRGGGVRHARRAHTQSSVRRRAARARATLISVRVAALFRRLPSSPSPA